MNLKENSLFWKSCLKYRVCFELAQGWPYFETSNFEQEDTTYRPEYVDECLDIAYKIFKSCDASSELLVIFEDIYSDSQKSEKEFIQSCIDIKNTYTPFEFEWKFDDEQEKNIGIRYIWQTSKIDIRRLFRKIIISDIGDGTCLAGTVYIVDLKKQFVVHLYDDRGIDVYSNNIDFLKKQYIINKKYLMEGELENTQNALDINVESGN